MNHEILISGPAIYSEVGIIRNAGLVIGDGKILAVQSGKDFPDLLHLSYPETYHLVPGFIDMHTHGASGFDVMDAKPEALFSISEALAVEGTTAFLATTMTASLAETETVIGVVRDFMKVQDEGASILGLHLEGPFIAASKMGAQSAVHLLQPDLSLMKKWQALSQDTIKLVTLAPEQNKGLELVAYLKSQNIIASIGHSNATYEISRAAIEMGAGHATHLFNAMSGIHHRAPGAVTAALLADEVYVEVIADGHHLHPAIIELILKTKPKDKIILVTDAMRAKCMQDGCYDLGGQDVHVKNGEARLSNGVLAGSVLSMPNAIRQMLQYESCTLSDVIRMTSSNPAKALNIFDRKGSIALNKDADCVVLNEKMEVVLTLVQGKIAYQA